MCRSLSEGGRRCPGKGGEYRRAQARRRYHERKVRDEFASRFSGGVPAGAARQVVTNASRVVDLSRLPEHAESVFTANPDEVRRVRDEARGMIPAASSRARSAMNALAETRAVPTVSAGEEGDLRMKMSTAAKRYATAVDKHGEDSDKAKRAWKSYERAESKVREAFGQTDERITAEREYVAAVSELGRVTETAILAAVAERGGGREEGLAAWSDEMERMGLTPSGRELFVFPFSADDEEDAHIDDVSYLRRGRGDAIHRVHARGDVAFEAEFCRRRGNEGHDGAVRVCRWRRGEGGGVRRLPRRDTNRARP